MATALIDWQYNDKVGAIATTATGGTLAGSHSVRVNFADTMKRGELVNALEQITHAILQDTTWPGAGN